MSKHPLVLSAEVELARATQAEVGAKIEAEKAMRKWAFAASNLGAAQSRLHYVRRYLEQPHLSNA